MDQTSYWYTTLGAYAIILLGMIIAMFTVCCKDFDPLSEFESRRRKQAKAQKLADKKAKKDNKKGTSALGKSGKASKKKLGTLEDEDGGLMDLGGDDSDMEKGGAKKKAKQQP